MVYKNEDLIFQALNVSPDRRNRWAKPMEENFIDKIVNHRPQTKEQLNEAWFGRYNGCPGHYSHERYHGLNYVNLFRSIETIEFHYGQASLHAGRIKSLVQFYLALGVKARNAKATSHKKIETNNPKFNFRVWLVSGLGMIGNEFKIARNTLTKNLPGNCAWR